MKMMMHIFRGSMSIILKIHTHHQETLDPLKGHQKLMTVTNNQILMTRQILMIHQIMMKRPILDDSSENNQGKTNSGGASIETQESSFEDATDADGASSSRQQLPPARKWTKDHTPELIIGNPEACVLTRSATQNECLFHNFLSHKEPKKVEDALKDSDWVTAMQEELNEFERNKIWKLVPRPKNR